MNALQRPTPNAQRPTSSGNDAQSAFNFTSPMPADGGVEKLRSALKFGAWATARNLALATGLDDRELRIIAEHHEGEFITGNGGYKLAALATAEEIAACADRLLSQGKKMIRRAIRIRRAAHERLHRREAA